MRKARRRTQTAPRPRVTARINDQIHARQVRLVDEAGEQVGVMPVEAALEYAESRELDLVEVAPKPTHPSAACSSTASGATRNAAGAPASGTRPTSRRKRFACARASEPTTTGGSAIERPSSSRIAPRSGSRCPFGAGAGACRRGATTARAVRGRRAGMRPRRSGHHLRRSKPHDVARAERSAVMSRRRHIHAIAELVVARLDASQPQPSRRLLRPRVRWVAQELDEDVARQLGVIDLVERCRDEHLARLDADQGLAALTVSWPEVVLRAEGILATRRHSRCSRCDARVRKRGHRCGRCGLVAPRPANRL